MRGLPCVERRWCENAALAKVTTSLKDVGAQKVPLASVPCLEAKLEDVAANTTALLSGDGQVFSDICLNRAACLPLDSTQAEAEQGFAKADRTVLKQMLCENPLHVQMSPWMSVPILNWRHHQGSS